MYGKKYSDLETDQYRMEVFAMNLDIVMTDKTFGMTPFLDLTTEEFAETYLNLRVPESMMMNNSMNNKMMMMMKSMMMNKMMDSSMMMNKM